MCIAKGCLAVGEALKDELDEVEALGDALGEVLGDELGEALGGASRRAW